MISADVLQIVVGSIRNDDVDGFRATNPGKVRNPNFALIDRNNDFLSAVNYRGFELCLVEIRDGNREVARSLRIPVITLCTGTRDPHDMWKWHPENDSKEAWNDMVRSVECGLLAAEKNGVLLAVEPEKENIVNSASRARQLLDELQNPRLRIVIDPANLIGPDVDQKKVLYESFDLLGAFIVIAHAKDRDRAFQPCAAGKGILDFGYYSRCLKGIRFAGPLVLHGLTEGEIKSSLNFLRRSLELELS